MEIIKGAQGLPGAEAWRRLAAHFDPNVGTRNLADLRRCVSPAQAKSLADMPAAIQAWENCLRVYTARTGSSPVTTEGRVPLLLGMCPKTLGATLASQQAMFPDY